MLYVCDQLGFIISAGKTLLGVSLKRNEGLWCRSEQNLKRTGRAFQSGFVFSLKGHFLKQMFIQPLGAHFHILSLHRDVCFAVYLDPWALTLALTVFLLLLFLQDILVDHRMFLMQLIIESLLWTPSREIVDGKTITWVLIIRQEYPHNLSQASSVKTAIRSETEEAESLRRLHGVSDGGFLETIQQLNFANRCII